LTKAPRSLGENRPNPHKQVARGEIVYNHSKVRRRDDRKA
jgi:hypothetical protein